MPYLPEQHGCPIARPSVTPKAFDRSVARRSEVYSGKVWPVRLPLGQAGCDLLARV